MYLLSYEEIRREASRFLTTHHPKAFIPTPIEEIVEFDLELNIIPIHGLQKAFDVESFSSSDLKSISIDKSVIENFKNRYRFSLAHEVGHRVLHRRVFSRCNFGSISEWKNFIQDITEWEYGMLEYQAYCFAGLVLVPRDPLYEHFRRAKAKVNRAGISISKYPDESFNAIAHAVARAFEVSRAVVERRIKFDCLWP